jgi:hypothetical protein
MAGGFKIELGRIKVGKQVKSMAARKQKIQENFN